MATYEENGSKPEPQEEFKLFVGGLHWETKEDDLQAYFNKEPYGPVKNVTIKMHSEDKLRQKGANNTSKSRCFGFVEFATREGMEAVLRDKDNPGHWIDDKKVDPKPAQPHRSAAGEQKVKKIFVGGVPPEMEEEVLRDYFGQYGDIEDVALVMERDQASKRRGFIFITYKSTDSVDNVTKENFHKIGPSEVRVEVKKAVPKDQQARRYGGSGGGGGRGGGFQHPYPPYPFTPAAYQGPYAGFYGGYGSYPFGYGGGYGGGFGPPAGGNSPGYSSGGGGGNGGSYGGSGASTGGTAYRYAGSPGGPIKSNYHQGTTNYHPYSR